MHRILIASTLIAAALLQPAAMQAQTEPIVIKKGTLSKERERRFVHEVKVLDEFIERFNDSRQSYLRQVYKSKKQTFNLSRRQLIQSLFNNPTAWAAKPEVKSFITQVTDTAQPQFLDVTDSNWYAQASCVFMNRGKQTIVPLVLQLVVAEDSSATWMIAGVGSVPFLETSAEVDTSRMKSEPVSNTKYIPPTGHSTNFLSLHKVFTPEMNPVNYFVEDVLRTERCSNFVNLVKAGKLKFDHTKSIKFYFFQVPNYVFTVERFDRDGTNSGWLINSLKPADEAQKADQKSQLLQRQL
jgi:hypothetical protein